MKKLILALSLISAPAFAQQTQPQSVIESLYARYQRVDAEAIQLQAQVSELRKQLDDAKKVAAPKEPEKK